MSHWVIGPLMQMRVQAGKTYKLILPDRGVLLRAMVDLDLRHVARRLVGSTGGQDGHAPGAIVLDTEAQQFSRELFSELLEHRRLQELKT